MTLKKDSLRFLSEGVTELQEYLLSGELFWPLGSPLPRLTIGSLLLAIRIAGATSELDVLKYESKVKEIHSKWYAAWEKKVQREKTNRLNLWSQFLLDSLESPDQRKESYKNEVRGRVIIQLLGIDLPDEQFEKKLTNADSILKKKFVPGDFIWDSEFRTAFPQNPFWFLYGCF